MANRRNFIGEVFTTFGSVIAAASAAEAGRQPRARDLRRIGIDPKQFRRIGR